MAIKEARKTRRKHVENNGTRRGQIDGKKKIKHREEDQNNGEGIYPFKPSVAFHIETNHLVFNAKHCAEQD